MNYTEFTAIEGLKEKAIIQLLDCHSIQLLAIQQMVGSQQLTGVKKRKEKKSCEWSVVVCV